MSEEAICKHLKYMGTFCHLCLVCTLILFSISYSFFISLFLLFCRRTRSCQTGLKRLLKLPLAQVMVRKEEENMEAKILEMYVFRFCFAYFKKTSFA